MIPIEVLRTSCSDRDDECPDIKDKVACYLYDPGHGMCPYLQPTPELAAALEGQLPDKALTGTSSAGIPKDWV